MAQSRREGNQFSAPKKLLREDSQARATMDFLEARGNSRVLNALPERDVPEDVKQLIRTCVRATRAYCQSMKLPVRLNEKDILKRTKFVADDIVELRDGAKNEYAYGPLEVAAYEAISDLFIVDARAVAQMNQGDFVRMFIHEIVHSIARQGVRITKQPDGSIQTLTYGGYQSQRTQHQKDAPHTHFEPEFNGFNEAMTDFIAIRAIQNAKLLPESYIKGFFDDVYSLEKNLAYIIFRTIAERTGRKATDLEAIFTEGYLNGTRMHLREIELHFGPQALRILSHLGKYRSTSPQARILNGMVLSWFVSQDNAERDQLMVDIYNYKN